ncbi:MAG: hypothetical protein IKZ88_02675, partial [Neisseriaceae bacterium]|nr:hypothetical protein [Neisseriaceae bacterium]
FINKGKRKSRRAVRVWVLSCRVGILDHRNGRTRYNGRMYFYFSGSLKCLTATPIGVVGGQECPPYGVFENGKNRVAGKLPTLRWGLLNAGLSVH